jgi:hypothetical protein
VIEPPATCDESVSHVTASPGVATGEYQGRRFEESGASMEREDNRVSHTIPILRFFRPAIVKM